LVNNNRVFVIAISCWSLDDLLEGLWMLVTELWKGAIKFKQAFEVR
jgi:hypothetical protein